MNFASAIRQAMPPRPFLAALGSVVLLLASFAVSAQCVSLTTLGSAYTQNFDTLSNTAGSTTNGLTITGWFMTETGGGARDNEQYAVDTGGSATGDTYSYGIAGDTNRALGQLRSGTLIPTFGACFTNNTGATIGALDFNYFGEQWRIGNTAAARDDRMDFQYSQDATSLTTGTWTDHNALDFTNPIKTNATPTLDGNLAANRSSRVATIGSLSIANGATFWIRWSDLDASGSDDGLAVDDFNLTPQFVVPLPQLNIGDVSQAETSAGATTFNFSVTLSAPAGPGGVTFDIATADGTAQDDNPVTEDNDYTANSLTGQTIPAGSSTFAFNVTVNGDVVPEPNETFFVNVTNVTGATVVDGQGQGTIQNDDAPCAGLSIGDATQAEGNGGTTTFAFTVSLSQAGCGTVSFDIATADGSAQDDNPATEDNDYVPQSLTGQTITFPATYTFNVTGNGDFTQESDESFFVNLTNVSPGNVQLADGQGLGTIVNDDFTPIHDIQGPGASSPIVGASVVTRGIVTGLKSNGFFMQEPDASVDADPATSEGIFVFTSAAPPAAAAVGNQVEVAATVAEFVPSQDPLQPPYTELISPAVVQISAGNPLPAAIPLTATFPDPAGPHDQLERLEGMRVSIASLTTSSPTQGNSVNEANATQTSSGVFFGTVTGVARPAREPGIQAPDPAPSGGSIPPIPRFDANPELIRIDSDGLTGAPILDVDSLTTVTGLVGPLEYGFRHYTILPDPTQPAPIATGGIAATSASAPGSREFTVASYNVERFYDTVNDPAVGEPVLTAVAYDNRLNKISLGIRNHLQFPDVIGLVEVENLQTLQDIAARVSGDAVANSQPDPMYGAFLVEGNDVGGIDVGILVKTAPIAGATPRVTVNSVVQENAAELFVNPDSSTSLLNDRPPLRLDATINAANGATFPVTVIVVHQRSLLSINLEDPGSNGWPTGGARIRAKRQAQAESLANLVQARQIANPAENIVLVGDFNGFEFNDGFADVMNVLHGTPAPDNETAVPGDGVDLVTPDLDNLSDTPPAGERYSYVFDGQMQNIDHAVANGALVASTLARRVEHPRINTDFRAVDRDDPGTARHLSDHDPLVAYFEVAGFASSDLSIVKTDNVDPVNAGQNFFYTVTVDNNGPDPADNVAWNDTLPPGTTFVSLSQPGGWTCTTPAVGANGAIDCSLASMAVGSAAFTVTVAVDASLAAGTVLSNTATATGTTPDPDGGNNSDTETTTVATSADLQISKTDTPDPVVAGTNLTYQITLTNNGPSNAANATFSDTLPPGTSFVSLSTTGSWSCTTPPVGATGTVSCSNAGFGTTVDFFTLVVNVDAGVAAGTILSNTASVASATSDPNPGNESATASTTVDNASADVSVTQTDTPDPVTAGSNLTYTITVANAGPSAATNVALADALPAGTTFVSLSAPGGWSCTTPAVGGTGSVDCTIASLGVGSGAFTLTVNVDPATTAALTNTATVTATSADPNGGNESATETTTVLASADLQITKTDTPDPISAGSVLTYTITVSNAGPSAAANVVVTDTVPAGTLFLPGSTPAGWSCSTPGVLGTGTLSCNVASLAPGANAVFTMNVVVDEALPIGTVITNTATATTTTPDSNIGNNSATTTTTVAPVADFISTKTVSGSFVSGSTVTYTAVLTNNMGHVQGNNFGNEFADILPDGLALTGATATSGTILTILPSNIVTWNGSIPDGGTVTVTITATITATSGTISNQGNAIIDTDNNGDNETGLPTDDPSTAAVGDATVFTVVASADLQVTQTDTPDPVVPGANLSYAITVTNAGPSDAADLAFDDTLPAGTSFVSLTAPAGWSCTTPAVGAGGTVSCTVASLAVGSGMFTLEAAVDAGVAPGTVLSNTATVASTTSDPNPGDESATAATTVGSGSADLSATIADAPDPVAPGENLSYTITIANAGPSDATTATLADTLPAGTGFVSLTAAAGWTCTTPAVGAGGDIDCSIATLGAGANASFMLVVAVDAGAVPGAIIDNTVTAGSATADPNAGNDAATASTTVGSGSADLSVAIADAPDPVAPGANLTYTITVANAGPAAATTAALTDTLPSGTSFVSLAAPAGWTCTTPAVGAAGSVDCANPSFAVGNAVFTLVAAVDAGASGTLANTASASAATADPVAANDSASTSTTVSVGSADLSVEKTAAASVAAGANLAYAIEVANAGPANAANAVLTDTLPTGTTFVSLSAPAGWTCTTPAVGSGGNVSCTHASLPSGTAAFVLTVNVDAAVPGGTVLTNTATVDSGSTDPVPANDSATATTSVISQALLAGTKTVSGARTPGSALTYTIVLTNNGSGTQSDNAGDEFTDMLPAGLTLVSASATSGTAVATIATNTVTWNGSIAAGASVSITIQATISATASAGTAITNQGAIAYDADGNGTNEAAAVTDDPGTGAGGDGTAFIVLPGGGTSVPAPVLVPASSVLVNLLLAAMLTLGAGLMLRRHAR